MRALEREVVDAVYAAIEPLLPEPPVHPLGCHRPRVPDRLVFWGILIRLTTGASWVDIEAILEHRVSDTTLRARRDEWICGGVSTNSAPKRSPRSTGSSDSTCPRSPSTGRCTKPPTVVKEPAPTPVTGAKAAGSGRSAAGAARSRWAGRSRAPTPTTTTGRRDLPRHHRAHRRQTPDLPRPLLQSVTTYPRNSLLATNAVAVAV